MDAKKKMNITTVVSALALFGALALGLTGVISGVSAYDGLIYAMLLLTTFFGLYYVMAGCKKAAGIRYFGAYLNLSALSQLVFLLGDARQSVSSALLLSLTFALLVLLAGAKDLGMKKSLVFGCLLLFLSGAHLGVCAGLGTLAEKWMLLTVCALLSVATFFMLLSKYADKAMRGKK